MQELDIIIKGDVDGSIEALSDSLMELSTNEVSVNIIHRSVGMISESDVSLASASRAIIIAFNVKSSPESKLLAKSIGVDVRYYSIIYEAIQEVKLALEGLLEPEEIEKALELNPKLIGINNRNLETFEVDLRVSIDLSKEIPADILTVSESGIKSPKDVKNLKSSGINAFLVGEAFMRAKDPGQELQELFFS